MIGLNASFSVETRKDSETVLAQGVNFALGLDGTIDRVMVVKVYREVEVVVPEESAPFGRTSTLNRWRRALSPFPVPSAIQGTRNDQFWLRVAKIAKDAGPNVQVIGVLIGDGFDEGSDGSEYREANAKLLKSKNFLGGAYIGIAPGAYEDIHWRMEPLINAKRLVTYGEVRQARKGTELLDDLSAGTMR